MIECTKCAVRPTVAHNDNDGDVGELHQPQKEKLADCPHFHTRTQSHGGTRTRQTTPVDYEYRFTEYTYESTNESGSVRREMSNRFHGWILLGTMFRHYIVDDLDHMLLNGSGLQHCGFHFRTTGGSVFVKGFEFLPENLTGCLAAFEDPFGKAEIAEHLRFHGVRWVAHVEGGRALGEGDDG